MINQISMKFEHEDNSGQGRFSQQSNNTYIHKTYKTQKIVCTQITIFFDYDCS